MLVDFHVHSTASDGTFTPEELLGMAKDFRAIALTDHDNCDGIRAGFIAGVELSIEAGEGFDRFHLLGLGIDPADGRLTDLLKRILAGRNERNRRMRENFLRIGIDLPEDLSAYAHGEVLARPHYARWLIDHGYAADVPEAFSRYLLPESPTETRCYEERWHPAQEDAIGAIHAAGGLAVMAHPKFWKKEWKTTGPDFALAEHALGEVKEKGLDGLEAIYQANTMDENIGFTRIARRLGLLTSAGSDFHGANKKDIPLGMDVPDDFIQPLLTALRTGN